MDKANTHVIARAVIIDQGHILLCKTTDLQNNFYFLPGGHIEHGESAAKALVRELIEEAGFEVTIKRFLGCLENAFYASDLCLCHDHDYSFIFEASSPELTLEAKIPKLEDNCDIVWMPMAQLPELNFKADQLKVLIPYWLSLDLDQGFRSGME